MDNSLIFIFEVFFISMFTFLFVIFVIPTAKFVFQKAKLILLFIKLIFQNSYSTSQTLGLLVPEGEFFAQFY